MSYALLISGLLLGYAILAWRDLRVALLVLTGLLPTYLLRFTVGPIPTTALEVMILITLAAWVIKGDAKGLLRFARNDEEIKKWAMPALLLLAAACFGVVVAPDVFGALGIWKAYFVEPMLVAVMMLTVLKKDDWTWIVRTLAVSALVVSIIAILQYLSGLGIPTPWDIERRVTGIFEYPNALGLYLVPIVTLLAVHLASSLRGAKRRSNLLWDCVATLAMTSGLAAIILAKTEAALVAIPAALFLIFLLSGAPKRMKWRVAGELFIVFILLIAMIPTVREKLFLQDHSGQVRLSQWSETTQLLLDHPAFGAGLNAYPQALAPYHDDTLYEIFQYPHTLIFNIWTELGLLGLVAFFWLAWLVIRSVHPSVTQRLNDSTTLPIFAALLTMSIHGLVDVPYFKNDLAMLTWVLIAGLILQTKTSAPRKRS